MRKFKIGAPGYILMDLMRRDMPGTLQALGDMGYDGIELLGFFGRSAKEIREMCIESHLQPYSCFVKLTDLTGETSALPAEAFSPFDAATCMPGTTPEDKLRYICELGCTYVGLLTPLDVMNEQMLRDMAYANDLCKKFGLTMQFHNHNQEYLHRCGDHYRMDYIMQNTPEDMLFEPDLGWMEIGGCRCDDQLRKYAHRIRVIHLKDYARAAFDVTLPYHNRPTGYGVMDWDHLLPLCEEWIQPDWYTADHDFAESGDTLGELKMSLDFIRAKLEEVSRNL